MALKEIVCQKLLVQLVHLSAVKDAHSATGVSVETNVKGLAADAVASSGPAVPPKLPAAPVTVRS